MAAEWSAGRRRTGLRLTAKACLALPLLLCACIGAPPAGPDAGAFPPSAPGSSAPAAAPPAAPVPQPQDQPPAGPEPETLPPAEGVPPAGPSITPEAAEGLPVPEAGRAPATQAPAPPAPAPATIPALPHTVTAYYVLLDDGGSNGVRFGCNDSLVGMDSVAPDSDPLPAAIGALLQGTGGAGMPGPGAGPAREMYNALADSGLKFLSGSFDGTTVTVYLAGALSLGGVCDIPRVEAQLTQTAVAAVGAIRAEIYVNGQPLKEALRQD
jgi:hypothetical protein